MSYIINISEMLKTKSRVLIFQKQNRKDTTKNIKEAGYWDMLNLEDNPIGKGEVLCNEQNILKFSQTENNNLIFDKHSKKYFEK